MSSEDIHFWVSTTIALVFGLVSGISVGIQIHRQRKSENHLLHEAMLQHRNSVTTWLQIVKVPAFGKFEIDCVKVYFHNAGSETAFSVQARWEFDNKEIATHTIANLPPGKDHILDLRMDSGRQASDFELAMTGGPASDNFRNLINTAKWSLKFVDSRGEYWENSGAGYRGSTSAD
jgi:hypothetical protein